MVRFTATILAFAALSVAVSTSGNAPSNAATENLNRRQENTAAQPGNQPSDGNRFKMLRREILALLQSTEQLLTQDIEEDDEE
ncbi:hypothetical protein J3459_011943 [Metarhizium acridum]|uniref:uncharacterized protein n=1 Tax=Metarhizium acridum TaxID=92637 RepID=UPI001C6C16EE|nr:hypothetical protein J3458_022188 [Metarhizium acridum]KAG8418887.1 hypothetical protein J3459_011943 [Metarhizium acridum]